MNVGTCGVTIPVEASPLWYPQPGDYWLIYGLVNPTIVIKQGEQVHLLFINMDNVTHVAAITTIAPAYSYMPMINGMMGGGSGGTQSTATWLAMALCCKAYQILLQAIKKQPTAMPYSQLHSTAQEHSGIRVSTRAMLRWECTERSW